MDVVGPTKERVSLKFPRLRLGFGLRVGFGSPKVGFRVGATGGGEGLGGGWVQAMVWGGTPEMGDGCKVSCPMKLGPAYIFAWWVHYLSTYGT